jgi:hypothetical protein
MQFMDNSVFEALTEEGTRIPPRKSQGRFHLDGDIVVADKAATVKMLRFCRSAFNATEGIPTAMVGPMPRYVSRACCEDQDHMANRSTPGFAGKMKSDLEAVNRTVKEFLRNDGYQNIRAMDPWVGLRQYSSDQLWGEDPVHIKDEMFKELVEGVKITLSKLSPKRKRDSVGGLPASKKTRVSGGGDGGSGVHGGGGGGSSGADRNTGTNSRNGSGGGGSNNNRGRGGQVRGHHWRGGGGYMGWRGRGGGGGANAHWRGGW